MNKIITTIALLAFTSVSANAIDFERFSITGGLASNQSIWGATAKQDDFNAAGTSIEETDKESGVFTDGYASQFIELGIGKYFSIGYEHTPDAISTPENINDGGGTGGGSAGETTSKVSVDFNDFNTTYAKLNLPFLGGAYIKAGTVSTDLDIKETQLAHVDA